MEAQHPSPQYWFNQGYRHGRAGNHLPLVPDDYPRVFSDDDPPRIWVESFRSGQTQAVYEFWNHSAEPSTVTDPRNSTIRNRLADRLRALAEVIDK